MAQGRPYQAYQKTSVGTSSQKQLVLMLFDGMNRFMNQGIKAIEEQDFEATHIALHKSGKILLELIATLREDKGGEIARNLKSVYIFCYEQTVIANLRKDASLIREIQGILGNISAGFKEISQKASIVATGNQKISVTG